MITEQEILDQIYILSEQLRHTLLELENLIEQVDKAREE